MTELQGALETIKYNLPFKNEEREPKKDEWLSQGHETQTEICSILNSCFSPFPNILDHFLHTL